MATFHGGCSRRISQQVPLRRRLPGAADGPSLARVDRPTSGEHIAQGENRRPILELAPEIERLLRHYGFPSGESILVDTAPATATAIEEGSRPALSFVTNAQEVQRGRMLFNATLGCAHCHGPNAQAAESDKDLRLLLKRHGRQAEDVFMAAMMKGRPGTQMPEWREALALDDRWLSQLRAFVFSAQVK